MSRIVGIDSMILVYAGVVPSKNPADSQRAALKVRAGLLLDHFARDNATIILPTIAISEILVPVPDSEAGLLIQSLSENFLCPTFDMHAADIAARPPGFGPSTGGSQRISSTGIDTCSGPTR